MIGLFNLDNEIYPEDDGSLKEDLAEVKIIKNSLWNVYEALSVSVKIMWGKPINNSIKILQKFL